MSYYKKVTLKDIANDSGVSVSSVSMILNKREGVSFSNETVENDDLISNENEILKEMEEVEEINEESFRQRNK